MERNIPLAEYPELSPLLPRMSSTNLSSLAGNVMRNHSCDDVTFTRQVRLSWIMQVGPVASREARKSREPSLAGGRRESHRDSKWERDLTQPSHEKWHR